MDHVLVFTVVDGKVRDQPIATCPACPPLTLTPPLVAQILLRGHTIAFKKSGTKVPRVELVPMGPSMDLSVRRTQLAEDDLFKLACKKPKAVKVRSWCWCRHHWATHSHLPSPLPHTLPRPHNRWRR